MPKLNPQPTPDECQRVATLCNALWEGSPTRMAKAIGCSPSAITNVTSGRQRPGRQLLAAIATDVRVNAAWLLTGTGSPLQAGIDA